MKIYQIENIIIKLIDNFPLCDSGAGFEGIDGAAQQVSFILISVVAPSPQCNST